MKYTEKATLEYLHHVKGEVYPRTPTKDCGPLSLLYGVGPVLFFVIENTTSMSSIIAAVRQAALKMVNARRGTPDPPSLYVLSQINDLETPLR